jgi:hypothetical protein
MSFRNKLFYAVDLIIALSFIVSAATGIILWQGGSGGYQGGENTAFGETIWGLNRSNWRDAHNWVSLVLLAGILVHVLLHLPWVVSVTKQVFGAGPKKNTSGVVKARQNLALDVVIGIAFVLSTFTGLVRWAAGSGGFQGGRNPDFQSVIMGLSRGTWSDLHTWTSLVMIVGVLIHLILHWSWIVRTTRRLLGLGRPATTATRRPLSS